MNTHDLQVESFYQSRPGSHVQTPKVSGVFLPNGCDVMPDLGMIADDSYFHLCSIANISVVENLKEPRKQLLCSTSFLHLVHPAPLSALALPSSAAWPPFVHL